MTIDDFILGDPKEDITTQDDFVFKGEETAEQIGHDIGSLKPVLDSTSIATNDWAEDDWAAKLNERVEREKQIKEALNANRNSKTLGR